MDRIYRHFAIKFTKMGRDYHQWGASSLNGIVKFEAYTLKDLKEQIKSYHSNLTTEAK